MRILATLAVAASAIGFASGAYDVVLVAGPDPSLPFEFIGDHPAVTATDDGFAVAWSDVEVKLPFEVEYRLRFARYDTSGHRTVDSGRLPFNPWSFYLTAIHLLPTRDGFAVFLGNDASAILTGSIGADGTLLRAPEPIVRSNELYPFGVASGSGGDAVLTYPEWIGTWTIWAVPLGGGGTPSAARTNVALAVSSQNLEYRFIPDAQLAAVGNGFATAWAEGGGIGVRTRELNGRGVSIGPVISLPGSAACLWATTIAAVGGVEAIVYSAGCPQTDLVLVTRPRGGAISAPIRMTADPADEGSRTPSFFERGLRAVGGRETVGVVYAIATPLGPGQYSHDWAFGEFDLAGRPVGMPVWLLRDLDIEPYSALDLAWDARRNRFLLAWDGDGPQGPGVYVMGIPSGR